jgi:hypothetical protein
VLKSCTLFGLALATVALLGHPVSAQGFPSLASASPLGMKPPEIDTLRITATATSPERWWVAPSDPVDEPHVMIEDVGKDSVVDLYPIGATTDARAQKACKLRLDDQRLALSTAHAFAGSETTCAALLAGFFAGDPKEIAISAADKTPYAVLALKVPTYQGRASNVEVDTTGTAKLPEAIHVNDKITDCLLFIGTWQRATCTAGSTISFVDPNTTAVLQAALARGDKLWLYINVVDADSVQGAWRRIPVRLEGMGDEHKPERDDLVERCMGTVPSKPPRHTYFVCVDAYPDRRNTAVMSCVSGTKCTQVGETVDTNHSFVVNVWTGSEYAVSITLGGTPGASPGIYDSSAPAKPAGVDAFDGDRKSKREPLQMEPPTLTKTFGARKPGPAKLVVSVVKRKDSALGTAEVAPVEYPFNVLDLYHVVVRLGLALAWQPWARSVGILATPDGQRYAAVIEGDANGLYRTEVSAGFTYFPWPIHQDSLDVRVGIGLRLGILSIGPDTKTLTSAIVGPELAIGTDLSIGLFAGVARHDAANTGFEPGKLVAPAVNSIPTHMTATGEFAITLNFTPGISKAIGVIK